MLPLAAASGAQVGAGGAVELARRRLQPTVTSTAFLAAVVAIAAWNVKFTTPIPGTDPSWIAGMSMSTHLGFDFGSQIIWTYGPLAFLQLPGTYYSGLATLAFCWQALLLVAYCASLIWALRRSTNVAIAVLVTFVTVIAMPLTFIVLIPPVVWCLAALGEDPPAFAPRLISVGGGALGALECLVRLSWGPVILAMCAATLLALPHRRRELANFLGTSVTTFTGLWFITGQGVDNFSDWVRGAFQVVAGYSEAMGADNAAEIYAPLAALTGILLVLSSVVTARPGGARIAAGVVMALPAFSLFKEAVVRFDDPHVATCFATAAPLAMAIPWRRELRTLGAALVVAVGGLGLYTNLSLFTNQNFNPLTHADTFVTEVRTLVSPHRREEIIARARFGMALNYRLEPGTLALLKGRNVHIDPWEAAVAWGYDLRWKPLPVFQDYQAYTAELDDENAEALESRAGPQRILRENVAAAGDGPVASLDNRNPAWDPPKAAIAMLCNYAPLQTTRRWQVLARSGDRCGQPRLMRSVETEYGRTVRVPRAPSGEAVFARIRGAEVSGFERLRSFLFRARLRYAIVNGGRPIWRFVPGTGSDGLIMSVPAEADFPGAGFALSTGTRSFSLVGATGEITVDFYAMPIDARRRRRL